MNEGECPGCGGFGVVDGLEPCPEDCPKSREVIALLRQPPSVDDLRADWLTDEDRRAFGKALMEMNAPTDPRPIVATTLRAASHWLTDPADARELREVAEQVERMAPGDMVCPFCQEMTCDAGCPLEGVRA